MIPIGKPTPGVPIDPVDPRVVRADIDAARAALGFPPLAPGTDTQDGPDLTPIKSALATIEQVQITLDRTADQLGRWIAEQEGH